MITLRSDKQGTTLTIESNEMNSIYLATQAGSASISPGYFVAREDALQKGSC